MNYKCKRCGESFNVTETMKECPNCALPICPENDVSGTMADQEKKKIQKEEDLKKLVESYAKTEDSKDIKAVIPSWDEYTSLPDFNRVWRDFIVNAAGVAVSKKDKDLQDVLKRHAQDFDSVREGSDLFLSLLKVHAKLGGINDWAELIQRTGGDHTKFAVICDSIMYRIIKNKDKAFAIEVFNYIKLKGEAWVEAGGIYVRALLHSEEIANDVLNVKAFNIMTVKFAKELRSYCKKYLEKSQGITVEQSKVWENYLAACKARKKRTVVISAVVAAVLVAVAIGVVIFLNTINKSTITFNVDKVIEVIYGEEPRDFLKDYNVSYKRNSGKSETQSLEDKMIGYNPELIGEQTVQFEFKGVTQSVTIVIKNSQLDAPVLKQEGNRVTWEPVLHATEYAVYVNATSAETIKTTSLSYDLSTNANHGELTVTVRAFTTDTKYEASPASEPLKVTKLQAPQNLVYQSGKLSWNTVAGATGYELMINGSPYTTTTPELVVGFVQGDNEITINAKGADDKVIFGVTTTKIFYGHLDPITGMSYQNNRVYWQAGENAKSFAVYVNGTYWKDFSRNYFDVNADGFASEFGEDTHEIGIICKTATMGIEPSEIKEYKVVLGNHITMGDDQVSWSGLGTGATYHISINGEAPLQTGDTYFAMNQYDWNIGDNTITVTASFGGAEYICETVTVIKHPAPSISVSDNGWVTDNHANNLYSYNNGPWGTTLPDVTTLSTNDIVRAKRAVSSATALEIASDVIEIKIARATAPTIYVAGGTLQCTYDSAAYQLNIFYTPVGSNNWVPISSVTEIVTEGAYQLRATLIPKAEGFPGYSGFLSSDYSAVIDVTKPAAPDVTYNKDTHQLTSTTPGAKFYYVDDSGVEHGIVGGNTSNMPGGVFLVYARLNATAPGVLNSANTPEYARASVFNLDITFSVTPRQTGNLCSFVFGGCSEIDSLTYSYTIEYLDASDNVIGGIDKSDEEKTSTAKRDDNIVESVNYRVGATFESGKSHADVVKIRVTITITVGSETMVKTATVNVPRS